MIHFGLRPRLLGCVLAGWIALPAAALDLERAREIYGPCAACHGEFGAGGKKGEYPRIAGQPPKYLEQQLKAFQSQRRVNLPMYPYTKERELPDEDMKLVADYLAQIELPTRPPVFKDSDDALTRLLAMEKVMIVPRAEGNIDRGRLVYGQQCAVCHGKSGNGRGMFPMLVGQYTSYLKKQIDAYLKADRPHDEDSASEGVLYRLPAQDIQDVLAHLTAIQEVQP
ncbi:c-type cytochrome [Accumulibacter sp.]|uniref:c-type cytochrome n=1 Tax=Accumulibacter sp. TaxID=2053492 RepID=UPI0025F45672|nr:c-type cytochrome [Accumulibacter sp.]MCM8611737.1 c-type cytochrome [Accumulibacter sp.]MCM8635607.1 c-type cytochrome [Accumulibacter sp.]MCM8639206.1 c-type cytochrome [Accumulibacter sp.]